MKKSSVILLTLITFTVALFIYGCQDANIYPVVPGDDNTGEPEIGYFNNNVGSYWIYEVRDPLSIRTLDTLTVEITEKRKLQNNVEVSIWKYKYNQLSVVYPNRGIYYSERAISVSNDSVIEWMPSYDPSLYLRSTEFVMPPAVGKRWFRESENETVYVIKRINFQSPAGSFKDVFVTKNLQIDSYLSKEHYLAPTAGIVYEKIILGGIPFEEYILIDYNLK